MLNKSGGVQVWYNRATGEERSIGAAAHPVARAVAAVQQTASTAAPLQQYAASVAASAQQKPIEITDESQISKEGIAVVEVYSDG